MGIRFYCPNGHKLNVKSNLAGKMGVCPDCGAKMPIPLKSTRPSTRETNERLRQTIGMGHIGGTGVAAKNEQKPASVTPFQLKDANPLETMRSMIRDTLNDPNVIWYAQAIEGQRFGPAPTHVIKEWVAQKRISPTMLVWCEGWPDWIAASTVFPELEKLFLTPHQPDQAAISGGSHSHAPAVNRPSPNPSAAAEKAKKTVPTLTQRPVPRAFEPENRPGVEENRIRVGSKKTNMLIFAALIFALLVLVVTLYFIFSGGTKP